ncbi:MAG: glycosyltransferase family 4 protein [Tepidisphaeraceae bacterium]
MPHDENPFRREHGLANKFVVMYSGNHTPANPLDTVLQAAVRLKDDAGIHFAFVGGGMEKARVKAAIAEHRLTNVLELPYQPRETLPFSLGAADVHVVTLGESMVGIVHPCKVYGAMAVGRPILFVGPRPSHVTDMMDQVDLGRAVEHGNIDGCINAIRSLAELSQADRDAMGQAGAKLVAEQFDHHALVTRFCEAAERVAG